MSDCNSCIPAACEVCEPGVSDSNIVRNRLDYVAWEDRRERMIANQLGARDYLYSISPFNRQFLVHPLLNEDTALFLVWDGLKMDFDDSDIVPVPEWAAAAIAAYVKWKILLEIDKRLDLAREQYDPARKTGVYPTLRLALLREQQEAQIADGRDEEYADRGNFIIPPNAFAGFGAQEFPFLSTVTALEGSDTTALAHVPTTAIPVPYAVEVLVDGITQSWTLRASTDANDPTNGVLRPNDYNATTNARVWFRI